MGRHRRCLDRERRHCYLPGFRAESPRSEGDMTFVQISDSHMGFTKPANPDVTGTLRATVDKINALPTPDFIIHTGDLSHTSKPAEHAGSVDYAAVRKSHSSWISFRARLRFRGSRSGVGIPVSGRRTNLSRPGHGRWNVDLLRGDSHYVRCPARVLAGECGGKFGDRPRQSRWLTIRSISARQFQIGRVFRIVIDRVRGSVSIRLELREAAARNIETNTMSFCK